MIIINGNGAVIHYDDIPKLNDLLCKLIDMASQEVVATNFKFLEDKALAPMYRENRVFGRPVGDRKFYLGKDEFGTFVVWDDNEKSLIFSSENPNR